MREYIEPALKGAFGYLPQFQGPMLGVGYLTAAVVLAIMTFPYIIAISREALLEVPRDQREAALALGATRWETTFKVVVPTRVWESWDRFFWAWRARWARPWRSRW